MEGGGRIGGKDDGDSREMHEAERDADHRAGVSLHMDFLIDGQISSFCPGHHGGWLLTLIMQRKLTQSL